MNRYIIIFKKTIAALLIAISLTMPIVHAHAQFTDFLNLVQNTIQGTVSVKTFIKETKLAKLALKIAKKILDKMTDSVIVWAAGGYKGEDPSFVGNIDNYQQGIGTKLGLLALDEIVNEGEKWTLDNLSDADKVRYKECTENEVKYNKYYNKVKNAHLYANDPNSSRAVANLEINGGTAFNAMLVNAGYSTYYRSDNRHTEAGLRSYIENEILSDSLELVNFDILDNPDTVAAVIKKQNNCQSILRTTTRTYTADLVKFVGETYRNNRKGIGASVGVPSFEDFGTAYKKSLSDNWVAFRTDASRGGWDAWGEIGKLNNIPSGQKFLLQANLSNQLATELGKKTAELQRNGGFLDKGECKTWAKVRENTSEVVDPICTEYIARTPGNSIREAVNQKVLKQYRELENVDEWSDLLLTTGVRLVSGILDQGLLPLTNNAIDKGLACLAGECGEDSLLASNVASSQTITDLGSGGVTYDDVVNLKNIFYGPLIQEYDDQNNSIYERGDKDGNIVREKRNPTTKKLIEYIARNKQGDIVYRIKPTTTNGVTSYKAVSPSGTTLWQRDALEPDIQINYGSPQYAYVYKTNAAGQLTDNVEFELDPKTHVLVQDYKYQTIKDADGNDTGIVELDANGKPIIVRDASGNPVIDPGSRKVQYARQSGVIEMTQELTKLLNAQNSFIRSKGVDALMKLDQALPGPDLGWEQRFTDVTGDLKDEHREIVEYVKRTFSDGYLGVKKDDSLDVVAVRDNGAYTNPYITFTNFTSQFPGKGPNTLKVLSDGSIESPSGLTESNYQSYIDATFPKKLNLEKADEPGVQQTYDIVNMNTFPGLWFDKVNKKVVPVGNVPDADKMREMILAVAGTYQDLIENYKRKSNDYRILNSKLTQLKSDYESLQYIGANSTEDQRRERAQAENRIAYEVSLLRDGFPTGDEVAEQRQSIQNLLLDYDRMSEMTIGTANYRKPGDPNYEDRFGDLQEYRGNGSLSENYPGIEYYKTNDDELDRYQDLFIKDGLGILYCAFQDHSLINTDTKYSKRDKFKAFLQANTDTLLTARAIPIYGPLIALFGGSDASFRNFGGFIKVEEKASGIRDRASETYGYQVPYRCFETSVICGTDGKPGCNKSKYECSTIGHNTDNESFLMLAARKQCSKVYKSSRGDYYDYIDPNS